MAQTTEQAELPLGSVETQGTPPARERNSEPALFAGLDNIVCGDVLAVLRKIPAESVHLIVTSPPYNLDKDYDAHDDALDYSDYLAWMESVWRACLNVLVPGGRLCVNIGENKRQNITYPTFSAFIHQLVDLEMLYRGTIIWDKNSAAKHCAWGSWRRPSNPHIVPRHEYIIAFSKGQWKLEGDRGDISISTKDFITCTRSVWNMGTESKKRIGHPAPFPEALPWRLINFYTFQGMTVLDPFAGSGTVGLVAAQLGRRFILGDNSEKYCELARQRIVRKRSLGIRPRVIPVEEL